MGMTEKLVGSAAAWESGELGRDIGHAQRASPETEKAIDDALGMQAISIRLPKRLIDDPKAIAKIRGVGYQPLIRHNLERFVVSEFKMFKRAHEAEGARIAQEQREAEDLTAQSAVDMPKKRAA